MANFDHPLLITSLTHFYLHIEKSSPFPSLQTLVLKPPLNLPSAVYRLIHPSTLPSPSAANRLDSALFRSNSCNPISPTRMANSECPRFALIAGRLLGDRDFMVKTSDHTYTNFFSFPQTCFVPSPPPNLHKC